MSKKNNLESFLKIKNQTESSADLYFYGDIVSDSWSVWQDEDKYPEAVKTFLDGVKGKDLNIYINSGGGSVFAGMAICNMLSRHQGFKTAYIDGLAASIASVIALVCDKIVMPKNSYLMIHEAWTIAIGNAAELNKCADLLKVLNDGIANIYVDAAHDEFTKDKILQAMSNETWMTGETAPKYFSKIETAESLEAVACASDYAMKNFKNVPEFLRNAQNQAAQNEEKQINVQKCKDRIRLLSLKGEI
ncbi:MAG: Clp protease ClpP [Candidatus Gastranaerophilales bacterium]|nr:Clp protease ClpP [Candidatus Gastranaerophilales bacterium]